MNIIKKLSLLALLATYLVHAEQGRPGATGTLCAGDACVWYLNVKNELTEPVKIQGYLLERVNVPFIVDIWYPYTFTNIPAVTELAKNTEVRVAALQDRSRDQRYWQFYTYHLNVIVDNKRYGFTIPLGWPQRSRSHTLTVSIKKHKWHEVSYPTDKDSLSFTVVKDEQSLPSFDPKAYGIAEMQKEFAIDQKSKYDKDTKLTNENCVFSRDVKTRLEHILKDDPNKTIMSAEDFKRLKEENPRTYEQFTVPVYLRDYYFTMTCNGTLTHHNQTVEAVLNGGLVYLDEIGETKVRSECPQDPHPNIYAEKP